MTKAGWREYAVAILLLLIGAVYLILQMISVFRGDGNALSTDQESIHLNKYALLNEIRTYLTIGSCIAGAILLIRQQRWGWILCLSMLLLFLVIAVSGFITVKSIGYDLGTLLLIGSGTLMMAFELVLLLTLAKKFNLERRHWLLSLGYCGLIAGFYFLLQ